MRTRCLLLLMAVAPAFADGVSYQDEQLEIEIVCEHARLQAGATTTVGVHFTLQPGWHLYWKNPGDSGLAPTVSWEVPDGYEVTELAWPAPERIPVEPLMTFGYSDELVILAEVTVPAGTAGTEAEIAAHVSWMTCADLCFEGETTLRLRRPVADDPPTRDRQAAVLDNARARVPRPAPEGAVTATRDGDQVRLEVVGETPHAFFPAQEGVIEPAAPQTVSGHTLWLHPAAKRAGPVDTLDGVLVLADRTGRTAWIVHVPVTAAAPAAEGGLSWAFLLGAGLVIAIVLFALIKLIV